MIEITLENYDDFKNIKPKKQLSRMKVSFLCSICENIKQRNFGTLKIPFVCRNCANSIAQKNIECLAKKEATCLSKYGEKYYTQTDSYLKKAKETTISKYGVEYTSQIPTHRAKTEMTFLKKCGHAHNSQTDEYREKYRKTCLEKYGVEHPAKSSQISKRRKKKYKYDDIYFDSKAEIEVYKFCKENGIDVKYHPYDFEYTDSFGKEHIYFPDFEINGKIYEVKGKHLWRDGHIWFPYRNTLNEEQLLAIDARDLAKTECMKQNNVAIIFDTSIDNLNKIFKFEK